MISCNSDKKKVIIRNDSVYTIDFDNTPKEEKIYMSSLFKKVRSIPLETVDESLIGYIDNIQIFDKKIFILDKNYVKGVLVFDINGKFIRKIGNIGQGPGEYIDLTDFTIDKVNRIIYLLDFNTCVLIYDIDTGKYIKQINISESKNSLYIQYNNEQLYVDAIQMLDPKENYLLYEIDIETGKYKNSWFPIDIYSKGWKHLTSFNNFFYSKNYPNTPKFVQLFMDTVFSIEKNGMSPFLTVKSDKWVSEDVLNYEDGSYEQAFGYIYRYEKMYGISNLVEGKDIILLSVHEGFRQWHVLCDNRNGNKNVRIAGFLCNDLLFEDERFGIWRLCCSDEKGVYSILPIEHLSFTENLDEKIKKDLPDREKLLNLKEDDNPVILYFEYE
jgi:hypothetical protein